MKKILMMLLFSLLPGFMKGLNASRGSSMDLARIKMSLVYLKSVETTRLLFISLLGIGTCLVFLFTGLILFHASLFVYSPLSNEVKMYIGFAFAVVYIGGAIAAFYSLFSQTKWMDIFHAQGILDDLAKGSSTASSEEQGAERGNGKYAYSEDSV